jgi:hypothetical protein
MGLKAYSSLDRATREQLVLERLQQNRIWSQLNAEREFSINYVERLKGNSRMLQNE